METTRIHRDRAYTLFELSDRCGLRVADLQRLVEHGQLPSHITDDTQVVNGKDFLKWAQDHDGEPRHYQ
ncbi:MAG TPA: hypothetical protein VFV52_15565 [Bacilli bacterium]|nr:hypothetical protein [Bacilli bacterium]